MVKWKITNLEYLENKDGLSKVVTRIFWVAEAENVLYSASDFGFTPVDIDEVDPESFVSFEKLDQETVVSWLKNKLGWRLVDEIEANVLKKLHTEKPPKAKHGRPLRW